MLDQFQLIHMVVGVIAVWSLNYFYLRKKDEEIKRLMNDNEQLKKTVSKKQLSIDFLNVKVGFLEKKLDLTKECSDLHLKEIDRLSFQLTETKEKFRKLKEAHRRMKYRYEDYRDNSKATIKELNRTITELEEIIKNGKN